MFLDYLKFMKNEVVYCSDNTEHPDSCSQYFILYLFIHSSINRSINTLHKMAHNDACLYPCIQVNLHASMI